MDRSRIVAPRERFFPRHIEGALPVVDGVPFEKGIPFEGETEEERGSVRAEPVEPPLAWRVVFARLYGYYGDPYWWPARDAWGVAVGAVLTQNTAWHNVEYALAGLAEGGVVTPRALVAAPAEVVEGAIRPSGYFRAKTRKLKGLARWWLDVGEARLGEAATWGAGYHERDEALRGELLGLWGVGPETADAILCYAFGRPSFVVDAYTRRLDARLRMAAAPRTYDALRDEVMGVLPHHTRLYNFLHGLVVVHAKEHCRARKPGCRTCPLAALCRFFVGRASPDGDAPR